MLARPQDDIIEGSASARPQLVLTDYGKTVEEQIFKLPEKYPNISIYHSVVMPNHVHMIVGIQNPIDGGRADPSGRADPAPTESLFDRADPAPAELLSHRADSAPTVTRKTLGQMIGYFKYQIVKALDVSNLWQRSYHDRIIRNEKEYLTVWEYIDTNHLKWELDRYYTRR